MLCPNCRREYLKGCEVCAYCQIPLIKKSKDRIIPEKQLTKEERTDKSIIAGSVVFVVIVLLVVIFLFLLTCSDPTMC